MQQSSTINRRNFLKKAATVAAGVTIPYFVPSSVLGKAGNVAASNRHLNSTILGKPFFGQVDAGHDLYPVYYSTLHSLWDIVALDTYAVDAVTYTDTVGHGFDVNVR